MSDVIPKVSCLCLSYRRVENLKNAISCFNSQSYKNREMVVVYRSTDIPTKQYLESIDQADIRPIEVVYDDNTTLGDVRNLSIEEAVGDYVCIWDDDDWYHKDRIKQQVEAILKSGKPASILFYLLMYDKKNNRSYMSPRHTWEQTIMCSKKFLEDHGIAYPSLDKGEDRSLVSEIIAANGIVPVVNPRLYIYCYSGNNTCDWEHFQMLFGYAQNLDDKRTDTIRKVFDCEYEVDYGSNLLESKSFSEDLRYVWSAIPGK